MATFSTVLSSTTMNADTIVIASVTHRVGSVETSSKSGAVGEAGGVDRAHRAGRFFTRSSCGKSSGVPGSSVDVRAGAARRG